MSYLLVFLQFLLIALIAYPSHALSVDWLSGGLFIFGLIVFAAALWSMKRPTFTVMPEPKESGHLITSGIYRFVRHPMYSAVLLCAMGASSGYGVTMKWFMSGILALILWIKLRREERMLLQRYPGYSAYRQQTKALVPLLF